MISTAILIFFLRLADVTMGTVRTILTVRGYRYLSALISFIEITIWVLAIGQVMENLNSIWSIVGYSGGFAAGVLLGSWIEQKLALGYANLTVISLHHGMEIAEEARRAGYGVTVIDAQGQSGPVSLLNIVTPRKQINPVMRLVNQVDLTSFVKVDEPQRVVRGFWGVVK
ncbi:MAG: DUF2179 domain-containing protein [Chloroflexi bacterium]|nr:MAG: DUF2179 domain-containing protein [Chloroflexota bacterium]MBL1195131.1 DUF2179 domain-containing protein [Chloroflexota bacterium]NOH12416.1 DUF2179 domain-containing protein [Chloroflexota bacterium]